MPKIPTAHCPEATIAGQLACQWQRPHEFVRRMISEGKLAVIERGLVTNAALHVSYKAHATELG